MESGRDTTELGDLLNLVIFLKVFRDDDNNNSNINHNNSNNNIYNNSNSNNTNTDNLSSSKNKNKKNDQTTTGRPGFFGAGSAQAPRKLPRKL
jgi:hypothetical protein